MGGVAVGPREPRSSADRRRRLAAAALGLLTGLATPTAASQASPNDDRSPPATPASEAERLRSRGATEPREAPVVRAPATVISDPSTATCSPDHDPNHDPNLDPNERPPLPPPNGQPAPDSLRRDVDHTTAASDRRRVVLTLSAVYASFRLPFFGRPSVPVRGGGVAVAAQVAVFRGFGARVTASHTVHAAYDEYARNDDDNLVQTAARGMIQGTHAGLSATYTMDLGRVLTTLDAGAGGMWIRSPDAVQDGQLGGSCRPEGVCDTGLSCAADDTCRVATTPQIHGGFAVDVLLGDRFTVGGELRYFALITAPTSYPVYLTAAARAGLRF